jgi:hypothetical protein
MNGLPVEASATTQCYKPRPSREAKQRPLSRWAFAVAKKRLQITAYVVFTYDVRLKQFFTKAGLTCVNGSGVCAYLRVG